MTGRPGEPQPAAPAPSAAPPSEPPAGDSTWADPPPADPPLADPPPADPSLADPPPAAAGGAGAAAPSAPVLSRIVVISNKRGLHARAAARFVTMAERFGASVDVLRDGQAVSARSIMGLMMLGAGRGCEIELRAEGWDAKEALDALAALVEAGFDEQD